MPRLQRLAVYTADALAELEAAFLPQAAAKTVARSTPASRKAAVKAKATPAKAAARKPKSAGKTAKAA